MTDDASTDRATHHATSEAPVFDCEQTVLRLWDYLDGQLGALDVAAIDAHLAACDRCPPHFTFERKFLDAVREARSAVQAPDEATTSELRRRVVARLAADGVLLTPGAHS